MRIKFPQTLLISSTRTFLCAIAMTALCSGCNTSVHKEFRGSIGRNGDTTKQVTEVIGFSSGVISGRGYAAFLLKDKETWFILLFPTNTPDIWPPKSFTTGPGPDRASVWLVKARKVPDVLALLRDDPVAGADRLQGKVRMWWGDQYRFRIEVNLVGEQSAAVLNGAFCTRVRRRWFDINS